MVFFSVFRTLKAPISLYFPPWCFLKHIQALSNKAWLCWLGRVQVCLQRNLTKLHQEHFLRGIMTYLNSNFKRKIFFIFLSLRTCALSPLVFVTTIRSIKYFQFIKFLPTVDHDLLQVRNGVCLHVCVLPLGLFATGVWEGGLWALVDFRWRPLGLCVGRKEEEEETRVVGMWGTLSEITIFDFI